MLAPLLPTQTIHLQSIFMILTKINLDTTLICLGITLLCFDELSELEEVTKGLALIVNFETPSITLICQYCYVNIQL